MRVEIRRAQIMAFMAVVGLTANAAPAAEVSTLTLKSKTLLDEMSPLSGATYQRPTGLEMMKRGSRSPDNGRTWQPMESGPDFDSNLPYGYRRSPHSPWLDPVNGNILVLLNCMDAPGKAPHAHEPRWQWYYYYLRYRVSTDGGRTWLFDEPIVQQGEDYSPKHPIDGVYITKNCFFLGDSGSHPIRTREGTVLVPMQMPPLDPDGEGFHNPGGGWYWLDSMILIGRWTEGNRIVWDASEPIKGDGDRTARGLYEPTLAQMPDGNILCVMRGSNGGGSDRDYAWPSHKWKCVSKDGGYTWSKPELWKYADGEPFFSPASMSELFTHSNGRIYWIGNLSQGNCRANHPRWPLVIGQVDPKTYGLIRESVLVIDTKQPDEPDVNLSHRHSHEDRETGHIIIPTTRASAGYKSRRPVLYVVEVKE
ncbi:MAG: exo-alpha-sialidase [Planctomycetes bacterium]|nr:exo-alpha-sialidase [Planctomycetota bacterium]MBL7040353.1 exo-alpha-sialidase [Pirellulaceae bacterium]